MISKSLSTSKKYTALYAHPLGEFCQSLYPLLVAHSDDFGRLEGDIQTVRLAVIPGAKRPENEISDALTLLDSVQLIAWYEVAGSRYLQIVDFERHQGGLHKRTSSRFPRVPGISRKLRGVPEQEKGTELKGTEEKGTRAVAPDAPLTVITKLAHEAIEVLGWKDLGDLTEAVKERCARARLAYTSESVRKAVDSAVAQRRRSA